MGKRLISANASEILGMNAEELKQSIINILNGLFLPFLCKY